LAPKKINRSLTTTFEIYRLTSLSGTLTLSRWSSAWSSTRCSFRA